MTKKSPAFLSWAVTNREENKVINTTMHKSTTQKLQNHISDLEAEALQQGPLIIKPTNEWVRQAQNEPDPVRIFGPLLHEKELAILFADQKTGKSALAVQIGNAAASGESITGFANEAEAGPVLYIDFELSKKQFEQRYNDPQEQGLKQFSNNFHRAEINRENLPDSFAEALINEIARQANNFKLVIIDNLTYLLTDQEKTTNSGALMQRLNAIKKQSGAAILLIAHTPKRSATDPITANDLAGSHMFSALADSIFALGKNAKEPELRYIKQINSRTEPELMGADHVATLKFTKIGNFLSFTFEDYEPEANHLRTDTEEGQQQLINDIKDYRNEKGYSIRQIADEFNITKSKVERALNSK